MSRSASRSSSASLHVCRWLAIVLPVLMAGRAAYPATARANGLEPAAASAPAWLEANGISVVDLVGFVPDADLQGAILSDGNGLGVVKYEWGTRVGNQVRIHVSMYPRWASQSGPRTFFGCIGTPAQLDVWGTIVPASRVRVHAGSTDITALVQNAQMGAPGPMQPVHGTNTFFWNRYPDNLATLAFSAGDALIPANRGCRFVVNGTYDNLSADYTFSVEPQITPTVLGRESFTFHSYIGPGNVGALTPLMNQMLSYSGGHWRHEKFTLHPPAGATYIFVTYPPMLADAHTEPISLNVAQPSGGTYRLARAGGSYMSSDHLTSMGLPLRGQWLDPDLAGSTAYLPFFGDSVMLTAPELLIPPGVPYNPCMAAGNCGTTILQQVYNTTATLKVVYLSVARTDPSLARVPLRQVGSAYAGAPTSAAGSPAQAAGGPGLEAGPAGNEGSAVGALATSCRLRWCVFFPVVKRSPVMPPDDATGCPCGWFAADGRMLGYIPPP